jgi:hypothetical protein
MKLSNLIQLITEELEVVLTNEEVGEMFGEDVQRELEESGFFPDSAQEEEAEAAELSAEKGDEDVQPMEEAMDAAAIDDMREDTIRFMKSFINSEEFDKLGPDQQKEFKKELKKIETIYHYAMKKGE